MLLRRQSRISALKQPPLSIFITHMFTNIRLDTQFLNQSFSRIQENLEDFLFEFYEKLAEYMTKSGSEI